MPRTSIPQGNHAREASSLPASTLAGGTMALTWGFRRRDVRSRETARGVRSPRRGADAPAVGGRDRRREPRPGGDAEDRRGDRSIARRRARYAEAECACCRRSATRDRARRLRRALLIDDDTLLYPDCAERILRVYEADTERSIVGVSGVHVDESPPPRTLDTAPPLVPGAPTARSGRGRSRSSGAGRSAVWGTSFPTTASFRATDSRPTAGTCRSNLRPSSTGAA